ncbi:MAG TPA: YgiT-type zinc finger protein [Spirochaetota bacterium]|nr:YgiT-type zinc finger protein [Spirochaetota bacterium]HNT12803.1 YgiT-type zinc finger protein [Spirochaetota bacterium]HNV46588.1 YgiT-type zinc finger protein [Spirochaetota bacterium]HOS39410.1 YgiT-type zinc finger protein [Spirochaetota bacterium]HPU90485.1 YgiT-type zinc finger protein [Spirochaetota bacterium]
MDCSACGGLLIEGKSCYTASKDHYSLVLEDIPAFQCTRCGRVLFAAETVDKIETMVKRIERESREIVSGKPTTNLYDF